MKKTGGLMMYLLSIFVLLSIFSATAQAFNVSGTVTSTHGKTVYLSIFTQNGHVGTSIATAPGVFTIQGVPAGTNYIITAFEDKLDTGSRHASDPSGFSAPFNVSADAVAIDVALTTPAAITTVPPPNGLTVLPSDNSALVMWGSNNIGQGEQADSYSLFWSTSSDVVGTYTTQGGSLENIPAIGDMRGLILTNSTLVTSGTGVTNGATLFFAVKANVLGATSSTPFTLAAPVTINPASGANTVSGTVTFNGSTFGKPLVVALVDSAQSAGPPTQIFMTGVSAPFSPQTYTIAGVPNGSYRVIAFLDLNGNSLIDAGDLKISDAAAPVIAVTGTAVTNADVNLTTTIESVASVRTNRWTNGTTENYGINYEIEGMFKRPVKVTLTSGPNVTGPIDIALDDYGRFNSWTGLGSTVPAVGDTYAFSVTYSDTTIGSISGSVTGLLSSYATPVSPVGALPFNTAPVFSWTAPATPPASYGYRMSLNQQNGGLFWDPKEMPGTQTSANFNFDSQASQPLTDNTAYNWEISVFDASGNSATQQTSFAFGTPTGNPINITTSSLPPATVGTFYSQSLFANGGSGSIIWSVSSGVLPDGLILNSGVISGTPTTSGPANFTIMATDSTLATNFATMPYSFTVNTSGAVPSLSFTGGVQDCTAAACVNLPGVTITTVGLTPELSATSDASGLFTLNVPLTTVFNTLPATAPFHLILTKATFVNTASSQIQLTAPLNVSDRPYALFSTANLTAWANTPGTGVIRSRIVDVANPVTGYIAGATVTASSAAGPLPVEYVDPPTGTIVSTGTTGSNGMYIIRNIPAGAQVTVNATAPNYTNFQVKQFTVYADTVSQGRITAVSTAAVDTQAPTVPTGLNVQVLNSNQINVNWLSSTDNVGVSNYQLFRNGVLAGQPAGAANTFWSDNALFPSTTYSYTVSACDAANNCSAQSAPVSATTSPGASSGPVNITGTISYNGSKTGRVYVFIQTDNGSLGTSVLWPVGTTSVPYTIRGVPSNNLSNNINAFIDVLDKGARSASSPAGSFTGSTNVKDITLSDPTLVAPAAPAFVEVKPGPASAFIMWKSNGINGVVDADSYDVYWSTSALVSSTNATGSKLGVPVGMDSPLVINNLTDGSILYFQVVSKAGTFETASTVVGPITIGATVGLNTVSGTVTFDGGTPTGPLYVAVAGNDKGMGNLYYTSIVSPTANQAFSISGIPDGSYQVFAILDLNNDNMFADGDATNTNSEQSPIISLSGNAGKSGVAISLISNNAEVVINTDHQKNGTNPDWYSVDGRVSSQLKRTVAVTLTGIPAGSTMTIPMDIGLSKDNNNEFQFWSGGNGGSTSPPAVGDTYTFSITYSDGSSETKTGAVTGVSNSFPTTPSISSPVSTVPLFSWNAPTVLPFGNYQYSLYVGGPGNNNMWDAWSIPSTQTQIVYGSGGSSTAQALLIGSVYNLSISSRDQNGNRATIQGISFTPTVAATTDTIAPTIVTTAPANGATGVSTNTQISITFSELIVGMPSTSAALKNDATGSYVVATGTESPDKKTLILTPSALLVPGTTYSIQLSTVTDLAGNPLPPTTLTFTTAGVVVTDTTPPSIISTIPANNATGVSINAPISVTFSEVVTGMPPLTAALKNNATGQYVAGTGTESADKKTQIFTPGSPLAPGTTYSIQFATVTDLAGNPLPVTTLTFTTAATAVATPGGDINGDGKIDLVDAQRMLEIAVGRIQATAADLKNGDVAPLINGLPTPDGTIGIGDVVVILRRIVGSVSW